MDDLVELTLGEVTTWTITGLRVPSPNTNFNYCYVIAYKLNKTERTLAKRARTRR